MGLGGADFGTETVGAEVFAGREAPAGFFVGAAPLVVSADDAETDAVVEAAGSTAGLGSADAVVEIGAFELGSADGGTVVSV